MPVAHAYEHRQGHAARLQPPGESRGLRARQLGDRRDPTEEIVVVGDLFHTLGRHPAPAQDVREKRADVLGSLRTAERNQQDRIERLGGQQGRLY